METVIIVLLLVLSTILLAMVGFLLWDRLHRERRLKDQGDTLAKAVGERIDGTITVFSELHKSLGELKKQTSSIEEAGKNILTLQEILRSPKPRGGLGELMLERLLADILPRDFYDLQWRFKSGETVDAVVRIGGNLVPIDAKFPLEDFERMMAAESDEERTTSNAGSGARTGEHVGQVILLLWTLGIFYHFYRSQGFFELVGQLVGIEP